MNLISYNPVTIGQVGTSPGFYKLQTKDSLATITATGYLNPLIRSVGHDFGDKDIFFVNFSTADGLEPTLAGVFEISVSGSNYSLISSSQPGSVTLPTVVGELAVFNTVTGEIVSGLANAFNLGNIAAGQSGTAGYLASFPSAASKGSLRLTGVANTGNTVTTISNAEMGQASVISIPDPGAATSEFIIADSAGTQNITSGNLQVDLGNIIAGSDANAGYFESHPATTASGTLRLAAVDSSTDSAVTISNASHGQATVISIPDGGQATAEFIISDSAGTQHITSGSLQVDAGNLLAGSSGNAGTVSSFPTTASKGALLLAAVDNTGDTNVTISNALHGQATVVSIPDGGQATTEFLIADSAGTQNITSGSLAIDLGNLTIGSDANAGYLDIHPATTNSGTLRVVAQDNAADHLVTVQNASHGQATVYNIPDVGSATGSILNVPLATADVNANTVTFDVTVGQAALAAGGTVVLQTSSGAKQYKIRELYLNSGGTNFSGGGGDRLATISDGTTAYSVIPAATMQALVNARWGATELPFPAAAAINTSTAAGANLTIAYSGGGTDYTAGSLVLSGVLERVA